MPQIHVLGKEVSELIAAGEVIERPASVIKEVVENSIDAKAKHITVEIKQGGGTFMRIVDDGCGMAPDEIPTAFLRHATSKVTQKEDLDQISTLGFRGEALASISAVSKISVLTKRAEDKMGSSFTIEGSKPSKVEPAGCPDGTTLVIRDLFYNVPVRRKFMKRDVAEGNAVSRIVQKIAMSHPEIAFRMIRDNRCEFQTDGSGNLYAAIYAICGKDFAHDLIPVSYEEDDYHVDGYVGKPLYARANRTFQNFFVNRRYVHSYACSTALENAYQNLIMGGKFPTCVLLLTMPPALLDVNIHPTKEEVRFAQEKRVSDVIYFATKNALMQNGLIYDFQIEKVTERDWEKQTPEPPVQPPIPEPSTNESSSIEEIPSHSSTFSSPQTSSISTFNENKIDAPPPFPNEYSSPPKLNINQPQKVAKAPSREYHFISSNSFVPSSEPEVSPTDTPQKTYSQLRVIGELFENYILAECDDPEQLLIFDKHAAHERVRYENLKAGASKQTSQMLLQPIETYLSIDEFTAVQENIDKLEKIGFFFDCTTPPCLHTLAVPSFILDMNMDEAIAQVAGNLYEGKIDPNIDAFDHMLKTLSCKSAVRAGDHNTIEELQYLVQEVWENDNIRHCPHGRPVMFVISRNDLEKQFRRRV